MGTGLVAGGLGIQRERWLPWVFREQARSYRELAWANSMFHKQEGPNVMPD
ncbi:hypothetical protein D3C75_378250 [compost metagenome]